MHPMSTAPPQIIVVGGSGQFLGKVWLSSPKQAAAVSAKARRPSVPSRALTAPAFQGGQSRFACGVRSGRARLAVSRASPPCSIDFASGRATPCRTSKIQFAI